MTGQAWGRITETSVRNGPAPSIDAASSISRGIVSMYWRTRNTSKALAKNVGTSSGSHVPTQPIFEKIVYVGTRVTADGRKIVAISSVNSRVRPGNRNRANPYATSVHDTTVPIIPMIAIASVLNSSLGKSRIAQTSAKLLHAGDSVHARSSVRHDPCHAMGGAVGFAGSMNWLAARPGLNRASDRSTPSTFTT